MTKKLGLMFLALMMLLAACGGGGGGLSAAEQAKADEIKAQLLADTSAENVFGEEEAATCFSEGLVSDLGLERINALEASGVALQEGFANLTAAEQEKVADRAIGCIDFPAMMREQLTGAGLSEDQANCVADGLDDDMVKSLLMAYISGQDVTQNADLMGVVIGCMTG